MDREKLLDILNIYFEDNDWPPDMDCEKLYERSSLSEEQYKPGWGIVEIERHRAVLGASYSKGQPMTAFQTYWMRYAVHPETGEIEELPDKNGEICINDMSIYVYEVLSELVAISIEPIKNGKYLISEGVKNYEKEISSFKDAMVFALELTVELRGDFQGLIEDEGLFMPDYQLKQLIDEYQACVRSQIFQTVKDLWEEREIEEDV